MDDLDLLDLEMEAMASDPGMRVGFAIATAEFAAAMAARSTAEQMAAIHETLSEARRHPDVFVDDVWLARDAGGADAAEFAERAAIADLAVRMAMSEGAVRDLDRRAGLLRRAPGVWSRFREGEVSVANARTVADLLATLPDDDALASEFDAELSDPATRLAPARFATVARRIRERLHPESPRQRRERCAADRRAWIDRDVDGMSWLGQYVPAEAAERAWANVDGIAEVLAAAPDETRTLDQLRADVAADLLGGTTSVVGGARSDVSVAVTVPVLTLLGASEESGVLEGYGPIDAETARRLAAHAPSFTRILTHPVSGAVLDVDRTTYRVPADLKRWLGVRDGGCVFPGCGRSARRCDLDHTVAWADGGATRASNLAHLCRNHHRLKHGSRWIVEHADPAHGPDAGPGVRQDGSSRQGRSNQNGSGQDRSTQDGSDRDGSNRGVLKWTSPTGAVRYGDPLPF